jgi:hypothetical protein
MLRQGAAQTQATIFSLHVEILFYEMVGASILVCATALLATII